MPERAITWNVLVTQHFLYSHLQPNPGRKMNEGRYHGKKQTTGGNGIPFLETMYPYLSVLFNAVAVIYNRDLEAVSVPTARSTRI